jgi:tetratricopeptide (TPR) repeat protein
MSSTQGTCFPKPNQFHAFSSRAKTGGQRSYSLEIAEQRLARARQAGDCPKVAAALTELGVLTLRAGDAGRAVNLLQEALAIVRKFHDRLQEMDVLGNLGMAMLATGDAERALQAFQEELTNARTTNDPYFEKAALEHIGLVSANRRDAAQRILRGLASPQGGFSTEQVASLLWYNWEARRGKVTEHRQRPGQQSEALLRGEQGERAR